MADTANTGSAIALSSADYGDSELAALQLVLWREAQSSGPLTQAFEQAFAGWLGRKHAIAVSSSTIACLLVLRAAGIGSGDTVMASSYSWRHLAHAIHWSGARPLLSEIDYWSQTLAADKIETALQREPHAKVKALLVNNTNGHPADWQALRTLAHAQQWLLIEDASESIGSRYQGQLTGCFGDVAIFDFSQPSALCCGKAAIIVTDDDTLALKLRHYRQHGSEDQASLSASLRPPLDAGISELTAALGLVQLKRLPEILTRRKQVEAWYQAQISSFEGIKPPYIGPGVDEVHWMLYCVHLGTRFSASSRDAMVEDMATERVEAAAYCRPLHLQRAYVEQYGMRKGQLLVTEKVADRSIALPFHSGLTEDQIAFIVKTAKDASINVGAGAAIYL
ncbi:DegT/DnrJ/EryC1/StrS family aminotransferase [Methylophilus sp. 3sh_L]|uniref:DegT/DnrJ/EryC1/StrS family aminotransferase n=1 Tax=Methylophilus sp. 3sh_L TaxID=3377114 RepID=UPI00398EBF92